jgi:hypothetical protein
MNRISSRVRRLLHQPLGKVISSVGPLRLLVTHLDCVYEAELARNLIVGVRELSESLSGTFYAQATGSTFKKHRKMAVSLLADSVQAERKNHDGTFTPVSPLSDRHNSLIVEHRRILALDLAWSTRATDLRNSRNHISEDSLQWSTATQQRTTRLVARIDEELIRAKREALPDRALNQVAALLKSLREELEYASSVRTLLTRTSTTANRVQRMSLTAARSFIEDRQRFAKTFEVGEQAFIAGDYVAARRHLAAARELAQQCMSAARAERIRRINDAQEWIAILGDKEEWARNLGDKIQKTIDYEGSDPFQVRWDVTRKIIDDEILTRACEMGDRDRKSIAERIGSKNTVKWGSTISWKSLELFARSVAKLH